ncbi:disulfide oxidoreductase [Holotrichia oblita]|nr:disulfide oxidoreductase [Holotrichia oblita]
MQYDLVIIGGGPGGYTGAIRAAKLGLKTAIIEYKQLGGTCLNRGCIPTKALLFSAELFAGRSDWAEFGINAENVTIDENKIYQRKDKIVASLCGGIESLLKANGVDIYRGKGYIKDKNTVIITDDCCGVNTRDTALNNENILCGNKITTKYILLATGSLPAGFDPKRPLNGLENTLNSDDVLSAPVGGDSVIIIGGGVIAVEFASYFVAIGKTVTLVVSSDRILKNMSEDISRQLTMVLKRKGLKIITNAEIRQLYKDKADLTTAAGIQTVTGTVITAVGRVSNFSGLGLENVGLSYDRFIKVDNNMRTALDNIYACGDITGGMQLAHFAAASAVTAVESIAGQNHSIDLSVCPACIYTQPEIAVVGRTEPNEAEGDKTGKFMMGANGKAAIEGCTRGYAKVVTDKSGKVVGGELFCVRATDMIGELALAVQKGMTAHEATAVIHPHPTVMEAVGESLEDVYGLATHILPKKQP